MNRGRGLREGRLGGWAGRAGKTDRRGRLITVELLIRVACFGTKVTNIFNIKVS